MPPCSHRLLTAQGESASLKRDRLMQRNTILRRTGFIEGGQLGPRTSSFLGACGIQSRQ